MAPSLTTYYLQSRSSDNQTQKSPLASFMTKVNHQPQTAKMRKDTDVFKVRTVRKVTEFNMPLTPNHIHFLHKRMTRSKRWQAILQWFFFLVVVVRKFWQVIYPSPLPDWLVWTRSPDESKRDVTSWPRHGTKRRRWERGIHWAAAAASCEVWRLATGDCKLAGATPPVGRASHPTNLDVAGCTGAASDARFAIFFSISWCACAVCLLCSMFVRLATDVRSVCCFFQPSLRRDFSRSAHVIRCWGQAQSDSLRTLPTWE